MATGSFRAYLFQVSPKLYALIDRTYRGSWIQRRRLLRPSPKTQGRTEWLVKVYLGGNTHTRHGPFKGMYIDIDDSIAHSTSIPKIIGSYEAPVVAAIRELAINQYDTVINIGAADGYYAIGLARVLPNASVYAYDVDIQCQSACKELARRNGVSDRVLVLGECTVSTLRSPLTKGALIICDIEGGEGILFNSSTISGLHFADLIIETHDFRLPGARQKLLDGFRQTHDIVEYHDRPRERFDYGCLAGVSDDIAKEMLDERRPPGQSWIVLKSRRGFARSVEDK
jgi:hypothetical protein